MTPLSEQNFIQDNKPKKGFPALFWAVLLLFLIALIWGGGSWYMRTMDQQTVNNPFLQVTNRQFSLFLWQFPNYMRVNVPNKNGYLPGFQYQNSVGMETGAANKYVVAPPNLIFLYHVWNRLISKEFTSRSIPYDEFRAFLEYLSEWQPNNWSEAPDGYVKFISELPTLKLNDLQSLPLSSIPIEVRMAFQGWKNYFREGEMINLIKPKIGEMVAFLEKHPNYARNYWRNIVADSFPNYLKALTLEKSKPEDVIPNDELDAFLKVAFFNYSQAKANK